MEKKVTVTFEQDGRKAVVEIIQNGKEANVKIDLGEPKIPASQNDYQALAITFFEMITGKE